MSSLRIHSENDISNNLTSAPKDDMADLSEVDSCTAVQFVRAPVVLHYGVAYKPFKERNL